MIPLSSTSSSRTNWEGLRFEIFRQLLTVSVTSIPIVNFEFYLFNLLYFFVIPFCFILFYFGKQKDLSDIFHSMDCKHISYFICQIPLPPVDERKKVVEDVDKDRRYAIDAAIVRIMKSRKVLGHQQLVSECVEQLTRMFKVINIFSNSYFLGNKIHYILEKVRPLP